MGSPSEEAHHLESTVWRLECPCGATLSGDNVSRWVILEWWQQHPKGRLERGPNETPASEKEDPTRSAPSIGIGLAAAGKEDPDGHPEPAPPIP